MTRWARPKLGAYAGLAAFGLLAGLVVGRPELVALFAPFLLALGVGLALATEPQLEVALELETERALEGAEVAARLEARSATPVDRLDLYVRLPEGLVVASGDNPVATRLRAGEPRTLELRVAADRWGGHVVGPVLARARDPLGFVAWEATYDLRRPLRVYPREEELRRLVTPRETQVFAGNEVARRKREGIEFADIRPFTHGDTSRRINWRASALSLSKGTNELYVNEQHPERNVDVIVFLDSFAEARLGGEGTLDYAVRAAAAVTSQFIERRDRVGLIAWGGILRWLLPGMGVIQLYRILDALLDTEIVLSYYWKEIDVIPPRTLPPSALVVALSPLLDERSVNALLDLRARGFDLAVVDVSPVPFTRAPRDEVDALAYRVWKLRRDALRNRYERAGVAVAEWRAGEPLQVAIEEVREFRRHVRIARA